CSPSRLGVPPRRAPARGWRVPTGGPRPAPAAAAASSAARANGARRPAMAEAPLDDNAARNNAPTVPDLSCISDYSDTPGDVLTRPARDRTRRTRPQIVSQPTL